MKQIYFFCLLFISLFSNSQIVNIPDANFKAKLLAASSSNTIASTQIPFYSLTYNLQVDSYNIIDTNNNGEIEVTEANAIKYLNIENSSISNLTGIEYFINLQVLNCNYNQISNINTSNLINLKNFNCYQNQLNILNVSNLPNLERLGCSNNPLNNINLNGLVNLKTIHISNTSLTNINFSNLTNLEYLDCNNNNMLTTIDLTNLTNLNTVTLSHNQITNLNLTGLTSLSTLDCDFNQFVFLNINNLPSLVEFSCNNNQITSLNFNNLPNFGALHCENNQLTNLDFSNIPNLYGLSCGGNLFTNLNVSNLNLFYFECNNSLVNEINLENSNDLDEFTCNNNNNLNYINLKNNSIEGTNITNSFSFQNNPNLQYICADESQVNDIQNKITEYGYTNCHVNTYCTFTPGGEFYTIQGQQKFDNENDGCDSNDSVFPNFKLEITNGTTTGVIISNNSGTYSIPVQAGSHTITPNFENPTYFMASPPNVVVNFPTQTSPFTQDFCITPNGNHHDVEISIVPVNPARPGFDANYKIIYKNKGNQTENGTINLQFNDTVLDVVSTNPAFITQTLNNLNWTYTNLQPFETRAINVVLNVNSPLETPAINGGDILNYTATNTITNSDEMISDNTFVLNQTVVNSYDPNDKTCLQGNYVGPDKIGNYVHYVIRFENTGTFPAENIVVKDMIDTSKFDVSTLITLDASHNYVTKITGNKVEFIFENINLPFNDATNDGYIAFKIKTSPTLVVGNTFSNSANIYFDYNFPIVTNTATTTIAALSNPSFEFANYFSLYPNPATNELNINLKSAIEINSIQIYNTIGQLVTVQTGNTLKVDVSNLKTGNYFIKINTNEGFSTSQFIKE